MVRRRSTVRFRKGAPGHEGFSSVEPSTSPAASDTLSVTRLRCVSRLPGISWYAASPLQGRGLEAQQWRTFRAGCSLLAKELRDAARRGDPSALEWFARQHSSARQGAVSLATAQLVIARELGFASWPCSRRLLTLVQFPPRAIDSFLRHWKGCPCCSFRWSWSRSHSRWEGPRSVSAPLRLRGQISGLIAAHCGNGLAFG